MTNKCTNKLHNHYPNGENNLKWELAWPWWGTFRKTELKYLMNKISANKHKQIKKPIRSGSWTMKIIVC